MKWFDIKNIESIDSPALVVYPDRIKRNIELAKKIADDVDRLRPHVKTNKILEVCQMMVQAGITKFKCATIAEAGMLSTRGVKDILLAYQPVGPKIKGLIHLILVNKDIRFSCLVDNPESAYIINDYCRGQQIRLHVFIDVNIGMNRTGIRPEQAPSLANLIIKECDYLNLIGLHGYDGHIHDSDLQERQRKADLAYELLKETFQKIQPLVPYPLTKVIGGTPTFPIHARRPDCECSPGTFVFWDKGYGQAYRDMRFNYAALVISRVISIIDSQHICLDLGYKAVASENPLPRVYFLNEPNAKPVAQSEEHLVVKVSDSSQYAIGQVFYGVPHHICPTVALYDDAYVIDEGRIFKTWEIIARKRYFFF